jgi:feruloyl esterase
MSLATASAFAALCCGASQAYAADCGQLTGLRFGAATIVEAADVAAGATVTNPDLGARNQYVIKNQVCRARGVIRPTSDSEIKFEVWLPPASAWNRRYQGVGNGGFAGSMPYASMQQALGGGYAVAATDGGHVDPLGDGRDARWAPGHPEKLEDYGWRAIHETAVAAKATVQAYYGEPAAYAYFVGCSNGGRQAFMEAQRFPNDYDGIVAGAPGIYQTSLLTFDMGIAQKTTRTADGWLSAAKLALLHDAVQDACHASGGFIADPGHCRFDPARLQCKDGASDTCLTAHEVDVARLIYTGMTDARGRSIYPGFAKGSELAWDWASGSRIHVLSEQFFRNMVLNDPNWDYYSLSMRDALERVKPVAAPAIDVSTPDLAGFRAAGGKLIHYHGWSDQRVPATASVKFYEEAAARMGGDRKVQEFYRLFMGPGMEHCNAGPGPNAIGGGYGLPASARDPEHDVVEALVHWVERGTAPAKLVATRYRDNQPDKGITAQRPWCPHPQVARLKGKADPSLAASYACVKPGR